MNIFEAIRNSVTARQAAEYYGIQVQHDGMACCPFHSDKMPSMKLDRRYHCFGCGADGDAIDFTAAYFRTDKKSAAAKLALDFGIHYETETKDNKTIKSNSVPPDLIFKQKFKMDENRCFHVYLAYYHLLEHWKQTHAPKNFRDYDNLFVEAYRKLDYIRAVLYDVFLSGTMKERAKFVREHRTETDIIEKRISEFTQRTAESDASEFHNDGVNADQ